MYDVIFDAVGKHLRSDGAPLKTGGTYIATDLAAQRRLALWTWDRKQEGTARNLRDKKEDVPFPRGPGSRRKWPLSTELIHWETWSRATRYVETVRRLAMWSSPSQRVPHESGSPRQIWHTGCRRAQGDWEDRTAHPPMSRYRTTPRHDGRPALRRQGFRWLSAEEQPSGRVDFCGTVSWSAMLRSFNWVTRYSAATRWPSS